MTQHSDGKYKQSPRVVVIILNANADNVFKIYIYGAVVAPLDENNEIMYVTSYYTPIL